MTMGAYDVIGKAKAPLDDTTMSMKWEVFGWPQKVRGCFGGAFYVPQPNFRRSRDVVHACLQSNYL